MGYSISDLAAEMRLKASSPTKCKCTSGLRSEVLGWADQLDIINARLTAAANKSERAMHNLERWVTALQITSESPTNGQ